MGDTCLRAFHSSAVFFRVFAVSRSIALVPQNQRLNEKLTCLSAQHHQFMRRLSHRLRTVQEVGWTSLNSHRPVTSGAAKAVGVVLMTRRSQSMQRYAPRYEHICLVAGTSVDDCECSDLLGPSTGFPECSEADGYDSSASGRHRGSKIRAKSQPRSLWQCLRGPPTSTQLETK